MNPELIRYARKHRYQIAEGFCAEGREGEEWRDIVETALDKFPGVRDKIEADAEELAAAAGITTGEAASALFNWIIVRQLQSWIQKNN